MTLKKFGDSLLAKSTKLEDISVQLDEAMKSDEAGTHHERIKKSLSQSSSQLTV